MKINRNAEMCETNEDTLLGVNPFATSISL